MCCCLDHGVALVYVIGDTGTRPKVGASISNMTEGRDKELPSFWIPNETPDNKATVVNKPVSVKYDFFINYVF